MLQKWFPNTKQYDDIRGLSISEYVDIISAGFPCQDTSIAGKGLGIEGLRTSLWWEVYRIIRENRPPFILLENSTELLHRGFEKVLYPLSEIGYNVEWQCLSNAEFGFPHLRKRLYVIGIDSHQNGLQKIRYETSIFNPKNTKFQVQRREFARMSCSAFWSEDYSEFLRMDNGIPDNVYRLESIGNAVNPIIANYLFECIKLFNQKINGDI